MIGIGIQSIFYLVLIATIMANLLVPANSLQMPKPVVFNHPSDIALDSKGSVFVADLSNNRVLKFSSNGVPINEWGGKGEEPGKFTRPVSVAVDRNGNVFIADAGNARIQKFTNGGTFIKSWNIVQPGIQGASYSLNSIAVDSKGSVYATVSQTQEIVGPNDKKNTELRDGRIQKYSNSGTFAGTWDPPQEVKDAAYQLFRPQGIAVGKYCIISQMCHENAIFVTDGGDDRIRIFSENGALLRAWGSNGDGNGQFKQPGDIAIVGNKVLVLDTDNNRVQILGVDGNFISEWGEIGGERGQFNSPFGIVHSGGRIFVADTSNNRIQVFQLTDGSCGEGVDQIKPGICYITQWG